MADWKQAGVLRHLIEVTLWSGFVILTLAIGLSVQRTQAGSERDSTASPLEWGINLQPRDVSVDGERGGSN